jgi:TPR repeat protein
MMTPVLYLVLGVASIATQTATSATPSQLSHREEVNQPLLNPSDISKLQAQAEAGDASAQAALARAYHEGNGVPQNDALAVKWFRRAADQGDAAAEYNLGIMYRVGEGVAMDKEEAIRWYKRSAKHGDAKAMFNLGASYYNGDGVAVDDTASYAWFLLAREAGNAAAADALRRAASERLASPAAAYMRVARMYDTGDELPMNSIEALKWYRKAADAGDAEAAVKVASLLLASGRRPTPDEYAESRQRCEGAAKQYSPGAYCMALIYRRGTGVTRDLVEGARWLDRAAELGHPRAALELGEAYWRGEGVKPDLLSAYMWIWLAYSSKVPGAEQDEQSLRKEMSSKQMERAKQKAIEWSRRHYFLTLRQSPPDSSPPAR